MSKIMFVLLSLMSMAGSGFFYRAVEGYEAIRIRVLDEFGLRLHFLKNAKLKVKRMKNDDLVVTVKTKPFLALLRGVVSQQYLLDNSHYEDGKSIRAKKSETSGYLILRFKSAECQVRERDEYWAIDIKNVAALRIALIKALGIKQYKNGVTAAEGDVPPAEAPKKKSPCGGY
jgi:hypothetical protein